MGLLDIGVPSHAAEPDAHGARNEAELRADARARRSHSTPRAGDPSMPRSIRPSGKHDEPLAPARATGRAEVLATGAAT